MDTKPFRHVRDSNRSRQYQGAFRLDFSTASGVVGLDGSDHQATDVQQVDLTGIPNADAYDLVLHDRRFWCLGGP